MMNDAQPKGFASVISYLEYVKARAALAAVVHRDLGLFGLWIAGLLNDAILGRALFRDGARGREQVDGGGF